MASGQPEIFEDNPATPPRRPVSDRREILIQLGIVTAGLFIALMLQGIVEWLHHRSIVAEARANIEQEIRNNQRTAQADLGYFQANLDRLHSNVKTIHALASNEHIHGSLINSMEYTTLDQSAWNTARDTGALAYMPYDEVQRYSDLYSTIDYLNGHAQAVADTEFEALAPTLMGYDVTQIPQEQYVAMLRDNARAEIGLTTLQQTLKQLDGNLRGALARSPSG
jgi:hypothetical protein